MEISIKNASSTRSSLAEAVKKFGLGIRDTKYGDGL
jgi:hypothetical protein